MSNKLQTPRLFLRELESFDLRFLFALLSDPEVMSFWPRPLTLEECQDWLDRQRGRYREHGYGYWLITRKSDGEPVGQAGLLPMEVEQHTEVGLGYIIGKSCWNQGYATEAAAACLKYAFSEVKVDRVIALIRPGNIPSERVAVKLSMVRERTVDFSGYPHRVYAVQRDGWTVGPGTHEAI